MGSKNVKSLEDGTQNAQERPPRKRGVAVVLDPEDLEKLEKFAKEDGPALAPSTLARLLLEVALQAREAAGSYKALLDNLAAERLRLRIEADKQVKETSPVRIKPLDKVGRR